MVDYQPKTHRTGDDRDEISYECLSAQHLVDYQDACHIASRTCHQQHETSPGSESFEHQGHGYGDAARSTQLHRHGYAQHKEHGSQGVVLENLECRIRYKHGDQSCHDKSHNEPFAYILHHIDEGIAKGLLQFVD